MQVSTGSGGPPKTAKSGAASSWKFSRETPRNNKVRQPAVYFIDEFGKGMASDMPQTMPCPSGLWPVHV